MTLKSKFEFITAWMCNVLHELCTLIYTARNLNIKQEKYTLQVFYVCTACSFIQHIYIPLPRPGQTTDWPQHPWHRHLVSQEGNLVSAGDDTSHLCWALSLLPLYKTILCQIIIKNCTCKQLGVVTVGTIKNIKHAALFNRS